MAIIIDGKAVNHTEFLYYISDSVRKQHLIDEIIKQSKLAQESIERYLTDGEYNNATTC